MQERRYLSLGKVSIPSLDDKLKLVGHCGMFDMLQLVGEVGKKRLLKDARTSVSQFRQSKYSQP